jgi:ribosomal-protein-alanine N-acetyltransferase
MSTLPLIVRPLLPADLPAVFAIEEAVFPSPWPMSVYESELARADPTRGYFALQMAGDRLRIEEQPGKAGELDPFRKAGPEADIGPNSTTSRAPQAAIPEPLPSSPLLGYAGFWLFSEEAHLMTIAVAPSWQGIGLGTWLLLAVLDQMESRGAQIATLEVRESNVVARSLYERMGFRVTGRRYRYYHDNGEDALILSTGPLYGPAMQRIRQERQEAVRQRLEALLSPYLANSSE